MFRVTKGKSGMYSIETDLPVCEIIDLDGIVVSFVEGVTLRDIVNGLHITDADKLKRMLKVKIVDYTIDKLQGMKNEVQP